LQEKIQPEAIGKGGQNQLMGKKVPLRELKKARSKIALFQASLDLIGKKSFKDVKVEDVCEKAEVSKVTFFKFFPQKEDVLIYFMCLWLTERMIELKLHPKRGIEAIRHLFQHVAADARERPGLMLSLIGFMTEVNMHPHMPTLSEAEIQILYPDKETLVDAEAPNLGALFTQFIEEAKEDGDIPDHLPTDDLVKATFTIFYGAYLTAHLYNSDQFMEFYDLHLQLFLSNGVNR
jgi:AcrR family transcriptional regulator